MPIMFYSGVHAMPKRLSATMHKLTQGHGILFSMHQNYVPAAREWLVEAKQYDNKSTEVMFDSGAFTAWYNGEPAMKAEELLATYVKAARWCEGRFKNAWFITLDVIPGAPHRAATHEEVTEAVRQSDINHKVLAKELGNRVLPVFHRHESHARLREVMDMNDEYICLAPLARTPENERLQWSRQAARIVGEINIHGL